MYSFRHRLVLFVSFILACGFFSSDHSHAQKDAPVEQELTSEKEKVVQAIDRLHFATPASVGVATVLSGRTDPEPPARAQSAVWDTIGNASEGLSVSSTAGTRRAILLLSDGNDTFSRASMRDAIEGALRHDVAVYAIGMGDKSFEDVSESEETRRGNWRPGLLSQKSTGVADHLRTTQRATALALCR